MGIIDYLYFRLVALRKIKKLYKESDIYIRIQPDFQICRAVGEKWIYEDNYKIEFRAGDEEYILIAESLRGVLRKLVNLIK